MDTEMQLIPNMGRILVKADEISEKSSGGILLPPSARDTGKARVAKVVEVGDVRLVNGERTATYPFVGQKVLIDPLSTVAVKVGGEDLMLLRVEDILGLVQE